MPMFGATVAVPDGGRILLQLREDVGLWNLTGGAVEPGESLAQAAVREVREETGLEVRLTRLVGIYSRPKWRRGGCHDVLFAAEPVGGCLVTTAAETLDVRFFDPEHLPDALFWWHRRMIADALSGAGGVVWSQNAIWPFEADRHKVAARARQDPALAQQLIDLFCALPKADDERLELRM